MKDILRAADCVLFDFDGPMCRLFAGRPAPGIARHLRALVDDRGAALTPGARSTDDPQVVLRAVEPGSELARLLERTLTEEETRAVDSAAPTDHADRLVRTLVETGRRVAVTTNNSEAAVDRYLSSRGLTDFFPGAVHGRQDDVRLLKPHPDCLYRALAATRTPAERALMIGDTVNDLLAARAAGVPFVGYAPRPTRRAELLAAGAPDVVGSLDEMCRVLLPTPGG